MKLLCCVKNMTIVFFLLFGLTLFFVSQEALAATAIGQMVWVKGKVEAVDATQQSRTLERRSPIYELDTIVTGSGTGQIIFTDNSTVVLREGTSFRIDEYKFNPTSPSDSKYVAGISKGGFRTITGLISKSNPDGYAVKTPVATIGVRGTQYMCNITGQKLDFVLERGVVYLSNRGGVVKLDAAKNRIYAVVAGTSAPVITDKPAAVFKDQPPISSTGETSTQAPSVSSPPKIIGAPPKGPVKGFCIN
jgi:hypothetical protein